MTETVVKAAAGALLGVVLGWVGNSLTFTGRVSAMEKTLERIELRMDQLQGLKR